MKRLILAALAAATLVTGVTAADAQRWREGDRGHGYYRGNGHHRGHSDHRWGDRRDHRRSYYYYRHGRRYQGWR